MSLSTTLSALQARFLRDFAGRGAFGEAADFARELREAAAEARHLEEARRQLEELLAVAADLDAHAIVAPPPALTRALKAGKSQDLGLARDASRTAPREASVRTATVRAATDIPGTNITVFPVVARPIPQPALTNRDLGDEDDGAAS